MKASVASVVLPLLLLTARAEAATRVDRVTGPGFEGQVTLEDGPAGVRVGLEVRFADGARAAWSGQGARAGQVVTARVRPALGAAQLLPGADAPPAEARTLTHELLDGGRRWRVRLGALEGTGPVGELAPTPSTKVKRASVARWAAFEGVPFVKGAGDPRAVHESDPRQGALGDCYLIAALIAVARAQPAKIFEMIQASDVKGEWTVKLRGAARRYLVVSEDVDVAVDRRLPVDAAGSPVFAKLGDTARRDGKVLHELWPAMIERALAQHRGGYGRIEGGRSSDVFSLCGLDGAAHSAGGMSEEGIDRLIGDAMARSLPVCIGFPEDMGELGSDALITGHHAYVVVKVEGGGFRLLNPWQSSHPRRVVTADELKAVGATIYVGG